MVLLDFLINTREDVELLVKKGIIVNKLGSNKAVTIMVNKLALEIEQKRSCYQELAQQLNGYYANDCNRNTLQKRLLLATARVRHNNAKSRRRLVVPTTKGRRLPSVILYYR